MTEVERPTQAADAEASRDPSETATDPQSAHPPSTTTLNDAATDAVPDAAPDIDQGAPDIDQGAPVLASAEADIHARPGIVWGVLADIASWPEWNPAVRSASPPGAIRVGATFRWAAGPGTINSRLTSADPPRLLAWTGRSMGLRAAHAWRVSPSADGATVRTDESLSGLPARLFAGRLRRRLQADLDAWVRLLKLEAESRAKEEEEDDAAAPLTDVPGEDRAQTEAGEGDASPPGPSSGEPSA